MSDEAGPLFRLPDADRLGIGSWKRPAGFDKFADSDERFAYFLQGCGDVVTPSRLWMADQLDPDDASVLDAGCGPAFLYDLLKSTNRKVAYTGIDESKEMLKRAIERQKELKEKVFLSGLESTRFPDASFDATVVRHVLEHILDPYPAIAELRRVTKRKLIVCFSVVPKLMLGKAIVVGYDLDVPRYCHDRFRLHTEFSKEGFSFVRGIAVNRDTPAEEAIWVYGRKVVA